MYRHNDKERRRKFWICDRKKCENCSPECRHTLDKSHAVDPDREEFEALSSGLWQMEGHGQG